ncbi:hypothetical protein ACF1BE_07495 [Streptomyces sp. NPDC014991]|uniref:hypothetical protein n=1 Tax=Streptomyces sp. NPDC014991 TaxID=3364935 RepID=UPI0036FB64E3
MAVQEPGATSGAEERPVPRDMPDQQAGPGDDPLDVVPGDALGDAPDEDTTPAEDAVPDTDEAGSGPQGAPRQGTVHPEHPGAQEPSD